MQFLHSRFLDRVPLEPVLAKEHSSGTQGTAKSRRSGASKLHIEKVFHLAGELGSVAIPPDLLYSWHTFGTQVLDADHLFQTESSVRSSNAARFHAAMRSFADSKAG